jgi:RNase P/RNase MRP subunit p29
LGREHIATERFIWKAAPWVNVENFQAIWISCRDGKLKYEIEFIPGIKGNFLNTTTNRMQIKDSQIIDQIEAKIHTFEVSGARGKGIIVGELELILAGKKKRVLMMSTLKDWRDWMENKRLFSPRKAT